MKRTLWITAVVMMVLVLGVVSVYSAKPKEEYVWACQYNSLPLFVNNDYIGMNVAAKELGVTVRKAGPQKIDLPAFIAAIEQEVVKRPAGMMVVGWSPTEKVAIDKAVDAGIPVVTVDADVPASKRLCFVGTNWYDLGAEQAKYMARAIGDKDKKGKVALVGMPSADNNIDAKNGYISVMKQLCPNVEVIGVFDSTSNTAKVAEVTANLISSHSDLLGVSGFDSTCGPGIATGIKEAKKVGQIWGTCVDAEPEHLQGVKDGALYAAVGQKRHFFTYYGVKMLYDYNHSKVRFTKDDKKANISPIPTTVYTGFIVATKDNVDIMLASQQKKSK